MARMQPNLVPLQIERNVDQGGVLSLGLGEMGSGKTNALVHICRTVFERKIREQREVKRMDEDDDGYYFKKLSADELVFWIGEEDAQWRRLPKSIKRLIFVERGLKLAFYRNGEVYDPEAIPFDSYEDLVKHAQQDHVNVVYLSNPHKVRDFTAYLIKGFAMRWCSVFIDEIESVVPGYESGATWHRVSAFIRLTKRSRKRRVSIYCDSQVKALIDHRFVALVMFYMFHRGARATAKTPVIQPAINNLRINEAWLATSGRFQKIYFPLYRAYDDVVVDGLEEYVPPSPPKKHALPRPPSD